MTTTALRPAPESRLARMRAALTRREWASIGGMAGFVVLLHVVGWGVLALIVAPAALRGRRAPGLRRRARADRLHARACGTRSTPTTSPPSTTPPAS